MLTIAPWHLAEKYFGPGVAVDWSWRAGESLRIAGSRTSLLGTRDKQTPIALDGGRSPAIVLFQRWRSVRQTGGLRRTVVRSPLLTPGPEQSDWFVDVSPLLFS